MESSQHLNLKSCHIKLQDSQKLGKNPVHPVQDQWNALKPNKIHLIPLKSTKNLLNPVEPHQVSRNLVRWRSKIQENSVKPGKSCPSPVKCIETLQNPLNPIEIE